MKNIITAILILMTLSPFTQAQPPDSDLRDEIEIMESVLGSLMVKNTDGAGLNSDAKGFYIKGYGVIFNVAYPVHGKISVIVKRLNGEKSKLKTSTRIEQAGVPDDEDLKKDATPEVKKALSVFFSKYASTMTGLKPDEKITIIADLNGFYFIPSSQKENSPFQVIATLSAKDIMEIKKSGLSSDQVEKKIVFNEIDTVDQDIAIFTNVLQTSLEQVKEGSQYSFMGNVKCFYIKEHGILFMIDSNIGLMKTIKMVTSKNNDKDKPMGVIVTTESNSPSSAPPVPSNIVSGSFTLKAEDYKEYADKIVKVISKYGHTLSNIKPDEYVEVAMNFNRFGNNNENSRGILRVKKGDIDDFNSGKIDFENFKKRVSTVYY